MSKERPSERLSHLFFQDTKIISGGRQRIRGYSQLGRNKNQTAQPMHKTRVNTNFVGVVFDDYTKYTVGGVACLFDYYARISGQDNATPLPSLRF